MGIFDDAGDLLPGLLPAAFKGQRFWVVDISKDAGRRIQATYFPGLDRKSIDDFGASDGIISLSGFVIGDDYVAQARQLQQVLQGAGPGTLMHPWLGEISVIPTENCSISFAVDELRVARLDLEFEPAPRAFPVVSSLSGILSALVTLIGVALSLGRRRLAQPSISIASYASGRLAARTASDIAVTRSNASRFAPQIDPVLRPALTKLTETEAMPASATTADAIMTALSDHATLISGLFRPKLVSAILPASGIEGSAVDVEAGAALLLSIGSDIAAAERVSTEQQAVFSAAEIMFTAEATRCALDIPFTSRQHAIAWRDRLIAAMESLQSRLVTSMQGVDAAAAIEPWQALANARSRLSIDLEEIIGRLPRVLSIDTPVNQSVWLVAQHLAGDDPARVVAQFDDIVRRNRLRHPAITPARLEALDMKQAV